MLPAAALVLTLLVLAMIVLAPLGLIWSLNVLFALGIPYTLKTWAAALVLLSLAKPSSSATSK